jgi:hypothetical protein
MTVTKKPVEETITIAEIESFLPKAAGCIEELLRAARSLPKVDKDGSSECPFAEEWYAKKEEAQEKVSKCLKRLNKYSCWITKEISRCKNNMTVISAHQDQLNNDRPRKYFSEAEAKLAALYKRLISLLEKVKEMFTKAQEAIREAAQKQYPGKIPNKDKFSSPQAPAFGQSSKSVSLDIDDDLRKMLRKGPRH